MLNSVRLLAMARKEAIQLRRDPRSLILAFLLPVFLLMLFGYAISWDVRNIATAVVDQDHSAESRNLIETFAASGYFRIAYRLEQASQVTPLFDRGAAQIALVIPRGFARDLGAGRPAPLQALVDGVDFNYSSITVFYTRAVVRTWSSGAVLQGRRFRVPIQAESREWFNEELASRNMIVPGLVATIMNVIAAMLTSLTIAREWERGTMEQLIATPVTRLEVVAGKMLPYVGIGLVDVTLVSLVGVLLFNVPFRGSVLLLGGLSLLFLTGALGLGIFISAVARSQLLATQMAMLATFLPSFLLSGFMFALEVMPAPLRVLSYLVPARYFLVVTRGIFLKGVGIDVLFVQALMMVAFALIGLALAVRAFHKELD